MRKYFPEVVNIFVMTAQERINLYMKAMEINRELSKRQFMQKENDYHHSPYETELEFYSAVRD